MGHGNPQAVREVKRSVGFVKLNTALCKHNINVVVIKTGYKFGYVLKQYLQRPYFLAGQVLQAFSVHRFHSTVRATNNSDFQSRPLFK
jgi:hypothetical protein